MCVAYVHTGLVTLLAEPDVLAVLGFGRQAPAAHTDPRYLRIALEPLQAPAPFEVWRTSGPMVCGSAWRIHYAHGDRLLFGPIELDDTGIDATVVETNDVDSLAHAEQAIYAPADAGFPHAVALPCDA